MSLVATIIEANQTDIPQLESLLNSAYRGEVSRKGWTTEAHLIDGEIRTDAQSLLSLMDEPNSVFLKYEDGTHHIIGCVHMRKEDDTALLGMLAVSPLAQGNGIGKKLVHAAENLARDWQAGSIYMHVISERKELIEWYERRGYQSTGITKAFPTDNRYGTPKKPLDFIILRKEIVYS